MPDDIANLKLEYDLVWRHGGKQKYQHVMIPQLINRVNNYCGCQTFPSKNIEVVKNMMEWRISIRVKHIDFFRHYSHNDVMANTNPRLGREMLMNMSHEDLISILMGVSNDDHGNELIMAQMAHLQMKK